MTGTRQPWAASTRASPLPSHWAILRIQVLLRDQHTCQACAGTRCGNYRLEVDHITRGDDHRLTNLQTLGRTCHRAKTQQEAAQARARTNPRLLTEATPQEMTR